MTVMSIETWRTRTFAHLRNKVRTPLVLSIDTALASYHQLRTPAALAALNAIVAPVDTGPDNVAESVQVKDAVADLKEGLRSERGSGELVAGLYPPSLYTTAYQAFRAGVTMVHINPTYAKCFAPWTQKTSVDWGATYQDFGPSNAIFFLRKPAEAAGQLRATGLGHSFIEVRVPLKPQPGSVITAESQRLWDMHIRSAWSGVKLKVGKDRAYTLDIAVEWLDEADTWGNAISEVATQPLPPPADWRAAKVQSTTHRSGGSTGTPHMAQFGSKDRQAILHEFGHLIGNCDEYNTREYMGVNVAGHYDKNPFTTNSIMNNTSELGHIFVRHYYSIKAVIEIWLNLPEDSTQVSWPGSLDGAPQPAKAVAVV